MRDNWEWGGAALGGGVDGADREREKEKEGALWRLINHHH